MLRLCKVSTSWWKSALSLCMAFTRSWLSCVRLLDTRNSQGMHLCTYIHICVYTYIYIYIHTVIYTLKYICIAYGCDKVQAIRPPNVLKLVSGRHFELSGYNHNPLACHAVFQNLLWEPKPCKPLLVLHAYRAIDS